MITKTPASLLNVDLIEGEIKLSVKEFRPGDGGEAVPEVELTPV